jgi:imidazole glycerol-phosphate synthase subunit HisH
VTSVALLDYGAGNLRSLRAAFERATDQVVVAERPHQVAGADLVVIPGVGAAPPAMRQLEAQGLITAVYEAVQAGSVILGVCLGLQLLFERTEEGDVGCLALLPGTVSLLQGARRLPHMGWNDVEPEQEHPLSEPLPVVGYFAHSYAVQDAPAEVVIASTPVEGGRFASIVGRDRIMGAQFHPERSADGGRALLRAALQFAEGAVHGAA